MSEQRRGWIWERLRGKKRKDLDKIQRDLVQRPFEKRAFVGDPKQAQHLWIKTRNKQ